MVAMNVLRYFRQAVLIDARRQLANGGCIDWIVQCGSLNVLVSYDVTSSDRLT